MPRLRSSRFLTKSAPHRSSWEFGPETSGNGAPQGLTASSSQLAGTNVAAAIDGLTLIRTRGEFMIYLTAATALGDGFHGAFGIGKATQAAVVAGVLSVPNPITEEAWDGWLYHRYFSCMAPGPIAVATAAQETLQNAGNIASLRLEVDSKAMRKWDINESMFACIEVIEHGTATAEWLFNSRMLVKNMS